MRVFLSYSSEDRNLVEPISLALCAQGHRVFFDRSDLPDGRRYPRGNDAPAAGRANFGKSSSESAYQGGLLAVSGRAGPVKAPMARRISRAMLQSGSQIGTREVSPAVA
jgi:hypothetical protein